jgi:hypothetical protein
MVKYLRIALLIFLLAGLTVRGISQSITNYSFSASTNTFTNLSGSTIPPSSGDTNEGFANAIPIGFDFWYMGVRYTTASASSNGWLTLGSNITNALPANSLTSGGAPRPILAPLWDDLNVQAAGNVTYLTSGTTGSRVFTIQYLNVRWQTGASGPTMSFQARLYERTGRIEFIYRQESGAVSTPSASIGIAATATGSGNFLSVSNTGTSVSSTTEASITSKPITGNTYSFTPPVLPAPTSLTFTSVNSTSMTLNWSDLSSNEAGFVIYRSNDGVNYTFVTQTATNATSSAQSGLTANTLYYWRIYAVSEGGLSTTPLSGNQTAACTPTVPPLVTSPVNYCQNAVASPLSATGTNLSWGAASGIAGGTATLTSSTVYTDNGFNTRKINFTTTAPNVKINSVDYYIPAFQSVAGVVVSIYNSSGTILFTSTTNTTVSANATPVRISNFFANATLPAAGNYSIGVSGGLGNIGADNPTFPITEATGTINITGVTPAGARIFNNIQFVNPSSSVAPTPSTATVGTFAYLVSQTVGGCTSPHATITVNVTSPNISQTPTSNLIANYKLNGNATDATGNNAGTLQGGPSATTNRFTQASGALTFNGSSQYVSTANAYTNPNNFTISTWFRTSTVTGGRLIGFGNSQTGLSGQYDRHIYMNNAGQLYFGVYPNAVQTINSTASYNDNAWHLATATLSSTTGIALYVDGVLVASNAAVTSAENYTGYWRIGYDNNNGWTSQPSSFFFNGTLDDVLIYHQALSAGQVATLYNSPDGAGNNGPACVGSTVTLTATTLPGATYSWTGPGGFTSSVQNPTLTYSVANAGVYTVTVTEAGCTATAYTVLSTSTNAGQWTGNVSTDWNTAGNWCSGVVPTATTDVVISAAAVRMPTIASASSARNLTINSGATVTTSVGGTLSIAGTLTNNGTMVNNGTTNFNGTTGQQTFSGVTTFGSLTVSNTSGLLLPAAITVNNTLTLAAGILNANNFNISVGGNWINTASAAAFTAGSGTVTINGSAAQSIGGTFTTAFNNLVINKPAGTATLAINAVISGNVSVTSGTFDLAAFTANRSAAGGIITVSNGATLRIGGTNTFPTNYATTTLVVASTVEYSGTNQTVANRTYGNLVLSSSSGAAVKTFAAPALSIVGNLITGIGTGTSVSFTAVANITVGGSVTLGASTTFGGGSFSHNIGGNWTNNGTFTGSTSTVTFTGSGTTVSGSGTQNFNNLTVAAALINFSSSSITLTGNLATTGSGSFTQASGGTLTMSGTTKTISGSGISLDNLTVSGSVSTTSSLALTGNLSVAGSFTASAGTFTLSGASKTISGAGSISFNILSVPGSVTAASNFTITSGLTVSGTFSASGGTATFTGTSSLSGTANLFNVTINGTSLQLSANSTLGIASTFTLTAGTLNATASSPTTVNFNGTGAQAINALTYYHLVLSNGNTKTAAGNLDIRGNIMIGTGTTFSPGTFTHSVYGNWTNSGTFTAGSSTVQFVGSATAFVSGATTFNVLTSNTSGANTELILQSNVTAGTVNMINGVIETGSNTLTITTTRSGPGYIYGNIHRSHPFASGTAFAFEGPNNLITFNTPVGVNSVTVTVVRAPINDFPSGNSISREYTIAVPSGSYSGYTLRLHYEDSELNGNDESTMGLWQNAGIWSAIGSSGRNTTTNYIEYTAVATSITGRWTASGTANVVQWNGSISSDWHTVNNWTVLAGAGSRPPAATDIVYLGSVAFVNHPTITSAPANVKNILFGSTQPVTLTLSGASLTTGDIRGTWGGSAAHTINTGNQSLTINGDLDLSDGTAGHVIDLEIGSGSVTVTGTLEQSGNAAITFSGAGNLSIANDFNYVNGTFTSATGTVTYNGILNQAVGPVAYHNLTINKSAGLATINTDLTINGNLTVSAGELDDFATTTVAGNVTLATGSILLNSGILRVGGNWNNSGTYTSNGSIIFNGSGPQSISATTFGNLEFNKPVGSIATLTGDVTLKGNLLGTSGTLDIQSFFFNRDVVGGTATIADAGTLIIGADNAPTKFASYSIAPNSTVIFNGTGTQHLALPGVTYGNITFRNAGQKILYTPITVNGKLLIESGSSFDGGAGNTITLNGDWHNDGTFIPGSSTVLASGTTKSIIGNTTFNQMTITGSYTILNNVTYNGLLNITSTGSLTGGSTIHTTLHGDLINSGVLNTAGTTTFSGNALQTLSLINAIQTVAVTVNFNGTVSPVLNSTSTPQYGFLNINNTGGVNPSVDWNILFALTVGSGASFNAGPTTQNIFGSVTNNGTITSNGTINLTPASPATINLGSNFTSTGLVHYGGTGAITLAGPAVSYYNVTVSNTHASGVTPATNWSVANNFQIAGGSTLHAGSRVYSVGGNFTSAGTLNSGTSIFTFNGTGSQSIATASPFSAVGINNGTGPISLSTDVNINGALNFTAGKITTGTHILIQPASGTINGASQSTGWVNGNLQKSIGTGLVTKVFEIGDATSYTPVTVNFPSVSTGGNLRVTTTPGDHPLVSNSTINPSRSVNRYWTLTNNGIVFTTYTVTPTWRAADVDAGASTSAFKVAINDGTWTLPATASPTATSIDATGVTVFGDVAVGQICNAGTTISYDATYCSAGGTASVTRTGTAGGTFSSAAGLSLNATTGDIDLAASTAGSYVVQYTVAASGGCSAFITSANVVITQDPAATISYPDNPYCSSTGTAAVTLIGTPGGSFSSITGLIIDANTGIVDLTNSTAGTYNVMYSIPASGGCGAFSTSTSITVTTQPFATGTYEGNPYCSDGGIAFPTGSAVGLAGTLTSTAGLVIDPPTGVIDLGASVPGTYTVTYNVPAFGGCAAYSNTATVAITAAPAATISYGGGPFCSTSGNVSVTFSGTTGGTYSATPSGLAIDPVTGTIMPATSAGNTYTITYTMAGGNGCAQQTATTNVTITTNPDATIAYTGSPYVIGGGTATVTLTGGPIGGTYSSTAGLVINTSTGAVALTTSTPGTYTVTYTVAAAGGCALYTTTAMIILNLNLKVWDGGAGTVNWGDANNWDTDGVPTATDNVELTGAYTIVVNVPAVARSLTLNHAALTLTLNSGNSLAVSGNVTLTAGTLSANGNGLSLTGDWINDGTFVANTSRITLNGTATQQIRGSSVTNFYNLNVTNTAMPGVQVESSQNLYGVLTLATNGRFDADGSNNTSVFTLISGGDQPTADAAIGILPGGAQVTGNVTVQRFMTREGGNSMRIYRYISSPVQSATVADIQNEIPVTGSFTGTSVCSGCLTNQSMFSYDESILVDNNGSGTADLDDGYIDFPSAINTETLLPGRGYAMYSRGNILATTLWDVRGQINAGNSTPVSLPVSYTSSGSILNDGWNLVGNPFPSTIDWNAADGWTKINLAGSIYISDNGTASSLQYATWNGVTGTNGGSRYISTGQGFWVKANGSGVPVLQATEEVKTPGTQTTFFRQASTDNLLRITLLQGATRDEAVVHFREDATRGLDADADAWKLRNGTFNLSTLAETSESLAINSWSELICDTDIKLNVTDVTNGSYSLKFSNLSSFGGATEFILRDRFLQTSTTVTNNLEYVFTVSSDAQSFGSDRFVLHIMKTPDPVDIQESDGTLSVAYTSNVQWYYNDLAIPGATISTLTPTESGTYRVDVIVDGCTLTGSTGYVITGTDSALDGLSIFPNPVTDHLYITSEKAFIESVTIINTAGKTVGEVRLTGPPGTQRATFSMADQATGVYVLCIITGKQVYWKKIVKK